MVTQLLVLPEQVVTSLVELQVQVGLPRPIAAVRHTAPQHNAVLRLIRTALKYAWRPASILSALVGEVGPRAIRYQPIAPQSG